MNFEVGERKILAEKSIFEKFFRKNRIEHPLVTEGAIGLYIRWHSGLVQPRMSIGLNYLLLRKDTRLYCPLLVQA